MQLTFFLYICVIIWENRFKPLPMIFQISTKVCHRTVQFVQNIDNHWMANCRDQVTIVLVISCKNVALIMIIIIKKEIIKWSTTVKQKRRLIEHFSFHPLIQRLTLNTPYSSNCFPYSSHGTDKENLFNNQSLLGWWSFPLLSWLNR